MSSWGVIFKLDLRKENSTEIKVGVSDGGNGLAGGNSDGA
jgi:hypothetical protein